LTWLPTPTGRAAIFPGMGALISILIIFSYASLNIFYCW
jgi:hypothetical protein